METSSLKRIVNKYTETSLIIRILIGMAIGVVLALAVPQFTGIKILGDLFVGALKAIAPLLVCLLIMSSLAQTKEGHNGNMKSRKLLIPIKNHISRCCTAGSSKRSRRST